MNSYPIIENSRQLCAFQPILRQVAMLVKLHLAFSMGQEASIWRLPVLYPVKSSFLGDTGTRYPQGMDEEDKMVDLSAAT